MHQLEGLEPEHHPARQSEARQRRRGLLGDTILALIGGLIAVAFVVGVGWRLVEAVR
jgi:hypothetical protein